MRRDNFNATFWDYHSQGRVISSREKAEVLRSLEPLSPFVWWDDWNDDGVLVLGPVDTVERLVWFFVSVAVLRSCAVSDLIL